MRMIRMQKVWKKIGAFVLALALVVPLLCGAQVTAKADTLQDCLELVVERSGCSRYESDAKMGLQKGDYVTVALVAKSSLTQYLSGIQGQISYDEKKLKPMYDPVTATDMSGWSTGWDKGKFNSGNMQSYGEQIDAGKVLFRIKFVVLYDIDKETEIIAKAYGSQNGIDMWNSNTHYYNEDVGVKIENSKIEERELKLSIVGNSGDAMNNKLLVPRNTLEQKQKSQIAVKVDSNSQYSGFKIACTYSPSYLLPYEENGKAIPFEFSDAAKAYINAVDSYTQTLTETDQYGNRLQRLNISVAASENINISGDFLYLNFRINPTMPLQNNNAKVKVQLYGASNDSNTSIKYDISNKAGTDMLADKSFTYGSGTSEQISVPYVEIPLEFVDWLVKYGDVNDDKKVDLVDATIVLQYYNGVKKDLTADQINRADVDQSGTVNLVDVLYIMKYYNGAINAFPHK